MLGVYACRVVQEELCGDELLLSKSTWNVDTLRVMVSCLKYAFASRRKNVCCALINSVLKNRNHMQINISCAFYWRGWLLVIAERMNEGNVTWQIIVGDLKFIWNYAGAFLKAH